MGNNKKIGLALGGGAVLGAAHIGVLQALEEHDITISYITGTSIGAFIAALYAFRTDIQEIREIALDLDWYDISGISIPELGFLSNEKLGDIIKDRIGDVDFKKADIPLTMVATDISKGEKVVLKEGSVASSVMASACIPGIFIPVEIGSRFLVDGGIVENVPINPLKDMGADFVIGVDLNASRSFKKPENIIEVLLNTFHLALMTATQLQTDEADLLIQPDLSHFNMIDTNQVLDLIDKGYKEAKSILKELES